MPWHYPSYLYSLAFWCQGSSSISSIYFLPSLHLWFSSGQKLYLCLHKCHRMSANHGKSDPSYRADFPSSFSSRTKTSSSGMELSPSRFQSPQQLNETIAEASSMSTLTMGRPQLLPSPSAMLWDERRKLELPSRPRSPLEKIELPSIRQVCCHCYYRLSHSNSIRLSRRFS